MHELLNYRSIPHYYGTVLVIAAFQTPALLLNAL